MPRVDLVVSSRVSRSSRARQLEAMFDVPFAETTSVEWHGDVDLNEPWHIGLIVGPSGSGKTSVARELFPDKINRTLDWSHDSVIDDFGTDLTMDVITDSCQSVGFNTIPAWLRPFHALSNGEQFRVTLARQLLEQENPIVVDEFTSVVDRQVAQIGSNAVQKYVRKHNKQFVAVSCHYDIVEWLQPDWVLYMPELRLERRSVQRRPELAVTIARVDYSAWRMFAPYHYLTAELNPSAKCYVLFVGDRPASFAATLHRPHPKVDDIEGISRLVTLPDWQGLGLAFVLAEALGAAWGAMGKRLHTYPAHPALIRGFDKSRNWAMVKKPGTFGSKPKTGSTSTIDGLIHYRPCGVFRYVGPIERDSIDAAKFITGK